VGAKFLLGPVKESYISRRPEDKDRDKNKTLKPKFTTSEQVSTHKTGPPHKRNEVTKKVTFIEPENSSTREKLDQPSKAVRHVPYVDIPPSKVTARTPVNGEITEIDEIAKSGPAYKTKAPVEVGLDIEKLVDTVLDLEINLPLRSLAGISGAIQKEIRRQVTKTRLPVETANQVSVTEKEKFLTRIESLPVSTHMIETDDINKVPEGHMVASDPVIQYLLENKDADPDELIAARPSESLRSIYTKINDLGREECILDNGSMIVSMAKATAVQLGLTWDPLIKINMESASNHLEKTLGLAKNVCFEVGDLKLYLQVHILENPPYKILLGRPFEAYTRSVTQTKSDGTSELILTDPNTKRMAIVPTYERGIGPNEIYRQQYQSF
jgi:hypothetical protein